MNNFFNSLPGYVITALFVVGVIVLIALGKVQALPGLAIIGPLVGVHVGIQSTAPTPTVQNTTTGGPIQ